MTTSTALAQPSGDFVQPADSPSDAPEILRIIAVGSLKAVNHHVQQMYKLGYAQPYEWSLALPTANSNMRAIALLQRSTT